jgi:hypothetical protein
MRDWMLKLQSGEYIREWRGFTPYSLGCFYGSSVRLGGEGEFSHCYDFFSGIGDVEWWIVAEIEKLTDEEQERMYSLMVRNEKVATFIRENYHIIEEICDTLTMDNSYVYRLGNKLIKDIMDSDNPLKSYISLLGDDGIINRLSFDIDTFNRFVNLGYINKTKKIKIAEGLMEYWYLDDMLPKCIYISIEDVSKLESAGFGDMNVPFKEDVETTLGIKL